MFLAAAVQLTATSDAAGNLSRCEALIDRVAGYGAKLVVTPENTNFLGPHADKVRLAEPLDGPTVARFSKLAQRHNLTLVLGSFNEAAPEPGRCYNTSVAFGPDGTILGVYRKIHLFDVDVSAEVRFRESDTVLAGDRVVVVDSPVGKLGLSVCYDLRFPELYQALVSAGAEILLVPSAFTLHTGRDHWHPLLTARAIETQSFVVAPGQFGKHDDGGLRHSYGHSLILDPWGHQLGMASDGEGFALAEIDLSRVATVRRGIPVTQHRRPELYP